MFKVGYRCLAGLAGLLLTVGCGFLPDSIEETIQQSAMKALEEQLDAMITDFVDGLVDEIDIASLLPEPVIAEEPIESDTP